MASSLSSAPTTISRTSGRLPAAVKTTGHLARLARQRATEPSRSPESCPLPVPRVPVANSAASSGDRGQYLVGVTAHCGGAQIDAGGCVRRAVHRAGQRGPCPVRQVVPGPASAVYLVPHDLCVGGGPGVVFEDVHDG